MVGEASHPTAPVDMEALLALFAMMQVRCPVFHVSVGRVITGADSPAVEPRNWPSAARNRRSRRREGRAAAALQ